MTNPEVKVRIVGAMDKMAMPLMRSPVLFVIRPTAQS
jgi:hypothetical protein